jgi:cyclopropane-fatty-acyl-phospholipid synthase
MNDDQLLSSQSARNETHPGAPWMAAPVAATDKSQRLFSAERLLAKRMLHALGDPPLTLVLWNGEEIAGSECPDAPKVLIRDRGALLKLVSNPEFWFGEMYAEHRIDVAGDLAGLTEIVYRAMRTTDAGKSPQGPLAQFLDARFLDARRHSLQESKRNIHHHYDIGNDFYRLWLDTGMSYTCAYFREKSMGLEDAQIAKMDHVCRKLWLRPGETVVEAGCGWGAMALHMARRFGVSVQAFNISHEQIAFARARARAEGLQDRVTFIEDDYRNIGGAFDAFVSIGMLEHVGPARYPELGEVVGRSLKSNGRGLIHSIGRDAPGTLNAWIERRIFPGAQPPSLSQMMQIFEPAGLSVLDVENLRLHYATTLEHWLRRFEASGDQIAAMFDPAFVRAWRLYLAGSLAAFRSGDMQLFQVVFARSGDNDIPWTRRHQYDA